MGTYTGIVQKGQRRGHELGYPTVNIPLVDTALSGVYAGRVSIKDEAPYMAAIFADPARGVLEAHVLDFSNDLYGLEVTIEPLEKIRDSAAFDDDETLRRAIKSDIARIRDYFKN